MQRYRWAVQDWIEDVARDAAPDVSRVSHKPTFSYTVDPHAPGQSLRTAKWRTEKLFDAWVIAGDDDFKPLPETSARIARRKRMSARVATRLPPAALIRRLGKRGFERSSVDKRHT